VIGMYRTVCIICLCWVLLAGCTDASLYGKNMEDPAPDRLGLTGRVCTDDPREAGFPVRVVFIVDTAMGPVFSSFDTEQSRIRALRETLSLHSGNDAFSFAVIGFGPRPRLLAPSEEGYFTRNPGELENAIAALALPQGCMGGICRDYVDALSLARSIIDGDLAGMKAGQRSRMQYVAVLVAGGAPSPLSCEYECCDPSDAECDFNRCVESFNCTKSILSDEVISLRNDIEEKGAASFSLHVLQLAAPDLTVDGGVEEELDRTEDLLQEMAFAGAGRFERFNSPDAITFDRIGLLKLSALLEAKSLLVTNRSTLPALDTVRMDSDGDGIADADEDELGTDPLAADSDGDGLGDMVETLISFNPLKRNEKPKVCSQVDGPPYADLDSDQLNDCEEMLLGTDMSLPDTDGDAVPDPVEVTMGTDYVRSDTLDDSDGDGAANGDEARQHTDPRSSDAASHLGSAYRYEVTDEGIVTEPAISPPRRIQGVKMLSAGADTTGGLGTLNYVPGENATISWQDPQDGSPGTPVNISKAGQYQLFSSSCQSAGLERWISVEVDPRLLPPTGAMERILVELSERHCLSFTVRNIRLVETMGSADKSGHNDVYIYFAQSPAGRLTVPGLFRVAHIPVEYHPETGRIPEDLLVEIKDEEFTAIGY